MPNNVIECRNLTLAYQQEIVVDRVNLEIPHGALLPFVGPNGAGKTTLFNAMLGLLKPRAGVLVRRFGPRPPGYVPQQKQIDPLYPVSVRQIMAMGLYPETGPWPGLNKALRQRLEHTMAWFGLAAHGHKTFAELSGGMRQKALIARAVISRPEVIFLDEPLAGLDAAAEEAVLQMLIDLNRSHGHTIILAH
ncbi:MAG: ATP-binding cassette domain-containing protein, partial [Lentisphaeria bacterium]|nr:ATP-binding cassette domain-containing protein [Lentisphaeria bacterium]